MTDFEKRLAELCEAEKKATPGRWMIHPNPRYWVLLPDDAKPNDINNAHMCALSRNLAREMIEHIRAQSALLEQRDNRIAVLEKALRHITTCEHRDDDTFESNYSNRFRLKDATATARAALDAREGGKE